MNDFIKGFVVCGSVSFVATDGEDVHVRRHILQRLAGDDGDVVVPSPLHHLLLD